MGLKYEVMVHSMFGVTSEMAQIAPAAPSCCRISYPSNQCYPVAKRQVKDLQAPVLLERIDETLYTMLVETVRPIHPRGADSYAIVEQNNPFGRKEVSKSLVIKASLLLRMVTIDEDDANVRKRTIFLGHYELLSCH